MILLTGCAGFIGYHTTLALLAAGHDVLGVDNLNDYYDTRLKQGRLAHLHGQPNFRFLQADIAAPDFQETMAIHRPDITHIVHLAAQAGVRYSVTHPMTYGYANLIGHLAMLELARNAPNLKHFLYASSSSVYGNRKGDALSVDDRTDSPVSLYAATKKSTELMTYSYSHLYALPATGLRFFTVYGPWGRPDMAPMLFARAISEGRPIKVFSHGRHSRDFTYVDDIVEGVIRASDRIATPDPDWDPARPDPATSNAPYRIYNIGNNAPVQLADFIAALETALGRPAIQEFLPPQPGDVPDTFADSSRLARAVNWRPATPIAEGVARFVDWYRSYHGAPSAEGEISGDPPAPGAPDP